MKIVIPSDLHFGHSEKHDEDVQRGMEQVAEYCGRNRSSLSSILIPGDVFNRPKVSTMTQRRAFDAFSMLPKEIPLRIITGNHDVNAAGDNALEVLHSDLIKKQSRIELYSEPTRVEDMTPGIDWLMVPYLPDYAFPDRLAQFVRERLGDSTTKNWKVLVTHADVPGAIYGAEREIKIGQDHALPSLDRGLNLIVSGHIHKYQDFIHGSIPGFYPGALARVSISEKDDAKGFVVLDSETLQSEFVPRKDARQYWRFDVKATAKGAVTLPSMKKVKAQDSVQAHVQAPASARGKVDRASLVSKAIKSFKDRAPDVTVKIHYDSEASKKVTAISKKAGLASYEQSWVEANVKTKTAQNAVLKDVRRLLSEQEQEVAQYREPLFIESLEIKDYQMIASGRIELEPGRGAGIVAASQGKVSRSNGLGKSTILEQAPFAFYGDTRYARNASVIRDGADMAKTVFTLQDAKGREISVYRTITEKSVKAEVSIEGEVKATGAAQTKALMQELLGLTQKGFDSVLFYAPDSGRRFSIVGARPSDRIKVLQDILDLASYDRAQKVSKQKLRDVKSAIAGAKAKIEHYESYGDEDDLKGREEKRGRLKEDIAKTAKWIKDQQADLAKLQSMRDSVHLFHQIDQIQNDIRGYIAVNEQKAKRDELGTDIDKLQKDIQAALRKQDQEQLKKDQNDESLALLLETGAGSECPTCGGVLSGEKRKERINSLESENDSLVASLGKLQVQIHTSKSKLAVLVKHKSRIEYELQEIDKLESQLQFLKKQSKGKQRPDESQKDLDKKIDKHRISIEDLEAEKEEMESDLADIEADYRQMAEARSKLAQTKKELQKLEKQQTHWESVDQALNWSGIPTFICRQLADNINEILPDVASDFDFWQKPEVRFEYDEDNDSILVEASMEDGPFREFEGLSAGQREVVNFIVREAVRRVLGNLGRCNLQTVWIDEALDKLDRENMERAARYFREQSVQALVVSHSYIQDQFDQLVVVESNGKYSKIGA